MASDAASSQRVRLRYLIHLCWVPVGLVVLSLLVLYYLAYTEAGLALLAARLNGRFGPVQIALSGASGTLAHGVHIDRLVIDQRRVHIEIEDASGALSILPLAWQTLRVRHLQAARLLIHALPRSDAESAWQPHFLPPLMRIEAERVEVQHWRLISIGGEQLEASDIAVSGAVLPKRIRIYASRLDYNGAHLQATGQVLAARSLGLIGALHFDAHPANQPPWTLNARIEGSLAQLAFDAEVTQPFVADLRGSITDLTGQWHWRGASQLRHLELSSWNAGNALGVISAHLQLTGDRSGFRAKGTLEASALHAGVLNTDFDGSWHGRVLSINAWQLHHAASGSSASAHGSVEVVAGGPRLDLTGEWSQFRWPLAAAAAPVHSEHGRFTLQGVRPFALSTQGDLRVADLPALQIDLTGQLASDGLYVDSAQLQLPGLRAQLGGALRWGHGGDWRVQGRVSDLDVAALRPGIVGQLGFALDAAGRGFNSHGELEARVSELSGMVRGQRASGHAHLEHHGDDWLFDDVRVQLGATRIEADGHAGHALELKFVLEADDLGLLQAGARGRLSLQGRIAGELADPTLLCSAHARDVQWQGVSLSALDASINFDPHGSGRADSSLQLSGLRVADRELALLTLAIAGTTAEHSLAFQARAEGFTLAAHGTGHYSAGQWLARIASAELGDQAQLHMQLEAPTQLLLAAQHARLDQACLHDASARLCAAATLDAAQRSLELRATDMPMRTLTAGLSAKTEFDGTLDVVLGARASPGEPWRGKLDLLLDHAAIHKHFDSGKTETLQLGNGTVSLEVSERELSGQLSLDAAAAGHIVGRISASGAEDGWRDWPLAGSLELDTNALAYLSAYVTQLDRARGRVHALLSLSGSVLAPQLGGELRVIDGQFDAYQINLSLREVNFSARLADNTLTLDGTASAGPDGHASVSGSFRWRDGLPYGELRLLGSDLRIFNVPEARVDVSPDVTLHMQGRRIELAGTVTLPYARIEPANLTDAVLVSSDERIVGEQPAPAAPGAERAPALQVFSNLTLILGERVTINTQGLSGRLSGRISVSGDDSGITRGSGELLVEEGKYLAYGRNLDIQHGRLLFSNGLIGDPGLDLRAIKKFPDITAGVNVRGTLRAPRMTFFSDPEVAQSQIVSLLLAGGSLESVQNSTSDPAARASNGRNDALVQGGAILAQQIGGRYDIEAGVEQDLTNETSLVLGRYLSPRLYLSYGVGLAEAINTVKMRYTIGDHWTIKTEAGTQRSADLVFTIEK